MKIGLCGVLLEKTCKSLSDRDSSKADPSLVTLSNVDTLLGCMLLEMLSRVGRTTSLGLGMLSRVGRTTSLGSLDERLFPLSEN